MGHVSVIVLGYGTEDHLEEALQALASQTRPEDEFLLVDNGIADIATRRESWPRQVRVLGGGANTGFTGGCLMAAAEATGEVLIFVNSDAIVRPGALDALRAAAEEPDVGIVGGCLRLADRPDVVNSVGNPLQFAGITWAGACGEPAARHMARTEVPVATGGLFALRREVWDELGGFDDLYFAYHEDTDLSLRCWLSGRRVITEPTAIADHYYEFGRNPRKMYLLERNRLITVLTDYPPRTLRTLLPTILLLEPAFLVLAVLQGWSRQKLAAWTWLVRHRSALRARRRRVQAAVVTPDPDRVLATLLSARIEPPMVAHPPGMGLINWALESSWTRSRRRLLRSSSTATP